MRIVAPLIGVSLLMSLMCLFFFFMIWKQQVDLLHDQPTPSESLASSGMLIMFASVVLHICLLAFGGL
jgi:hypothetical protein